jgi:hypothetical protein
LRACHETVFLQPLRKRHTSEEIWQTKLSHDFPGRKITVTFPEDALKDILEYQITFFQEQ